jgi:hypothetical protein
MNHVSNPGKERYFSFIFSKMPTSALKPTRPPLQFVSGPPPVGKADGREADHSPPSGAEVKNAWSYTSVPPRDFMPSCSVKHRDKFINTCSVQSDP